MKLKSLVNARDLSAEQVAELISFSQKIKKSPEKYATALKGKTVVQFFIENSTRTKTSFEVAARKLGAVSMGFAAGSSSLSKGESLIDTAQTLKQYGADILVMRHQASGAPTMLQEYFNYHKINCSVVNAGDGTHEHPTQALLDALTLTEHWNLNAEAAPAKLFSNKTIMIVGDILHSRVARSNIHTLTKLGARVVLCAPITLLPSDLSLFPKVEIIHRLDDTRGRAMLAEVDAVMCLRIQFERQTGSISFNGYVPSKNEYRHFWGMTVERAQELKKSAVILHPGPMNRGLEIDAEVADSSQSLILKQVENGVWMRMAVLAALGGVES